MFSIIEEFSILHTDQLHELFQQIWWSKGRSNEEVAILLTTCIPLGVIENDTEKLIGFARVLTDKIKYAYIFDVMIAETHRGRGLGKLLMEKIISHPKLGNIKNFELTCAADVEDFYKKFNFSGDYGNVRPMKLTREIKHT